MKNYITGLDGLRAIAALTVVVGHIEFSKSRNTHFFSLENRLPSAHTGVILFFVISGYLITKLLLQEKEKHKSINIKKFYARRIFRIWPLYYFILALSALLFQYIPQPLTLVYCLTILPNVAQSITLGWAMSPQIWSIGVEEQFYLFWPALIKFSRAKMLLLILFLLAFFTFLPHILLFIIQRSQAADPGMVNFINKFFFGAKYGCMVMGGLLAYLEVHHSRFIDYIRYQKTAILLIILPFVCWILHVEILYFTDEFFAFLFCLLIANITRRNYLFFNNPVFRYLGKISYGIYMYHWIVLLLFLKLIYPTNVFNTSLKFTLALYVFTLTVTIGLASLSYYTLESYFFRKKRKYEVV